MATFNTLTKKWLSPKEVLGVSVTLLGADSPSISAIEVVLKKGKVEVGKVYDSIGGGAIEVANVIDKDLPIILNINGKGFIWRKVTTNTDETDAELVTKILPGAQLKDLYLQKTPINDRELFVTVVRKQLLDEVLGAFAKAGLHVIHIGFGPFAVADIVHLIESTGDGGYQTIVAGDNQLVFEDGVLRDVQMGGASLIADKTVDVAGLKIQNQHLSVFALAVTYITNSDGLDVPLVPTVQAEEDEFLQKTLFKTALVGVLAFFFVVLLVNFMVFSSVYKKHQELETQMGMSKSSLELYDKLKKKYDNTSAFLTKQGWMDASRSSYFADQIASTVPQDIQLTELSVFPLEGRNQTDEPDSLLTFSNKEIWIKGKARKSSIVNDWMLGLKAVSWIKDVRIDLYQQEKQSSAGVFSLIVTVK